MQDFFHRRCLPRFGFPLTSVLVFRFDVGVAPPEILLQALLSAGCFYAVYYVTYKTRLRKRVADVPRRPCRD